MQNEIITLETAKLAKEKGFNIPVDNFINPNGVWDSKKTTTFYMNDGYCDGVDDIGGTIKQDYNNFEVNTMDYVALGNYYNEDGIEENYSAPTQSLLQRWLREKHKINISMINGSNTVNLYYYEINMFNKFPIKGDGSKNYTYEQALEEGLYEALKLIKN